MEQKQPKMVTCNVGYGRKIDYVTLHRKYMEKRVRLLQTIVARRLRSINSWFFPPLSVVCNRLISEQFMKIIIFIIFILSTN